MFGSGRCGWRGGEWMIGLGLGFTNPVRTGGVLDVCLCSGCGDVGGVGGEWVWDLDQGLEGGWCYVCVVKSCCTLCISASLHAFVYC